MKIENIILIILFAIIGLCIAIPIIFVSGIISKICIIIGLIALVGLSGFANYLTYDPEKK